MCNILCIPLYIQPRLSNFLCFFTALFDINSANLVCIHSFQYFKMYFLWPSFFCPQTRDLFFLDQNRIIETSVLYNSKKIIDRTLTLHPIRYPKFMYRLYSYLMEIKLNSSNEEATDAVEEIEVTYPFVPTHLRSSFKPSRSMGKCENKPEEVSPKKQTPTTSTNNLNIRPRHMPKNKFEVNAWEYFNQTRLMSINNEQPSRGIIGGIREEARYALTKGIFVANQGLPSTERLVFEKLENGYHRVDPMRGSEYILDFVFRKSLDRTTRVKKRVSILRPFHEVIVPVDSVQHKPRVNFIVTLSGLSERLEQFIKTFEKNVLIPKEDASLTIALYNSPDAPKVHSLIGKYTKDYPYSMLKVIDVEGEFARGVGLHHGAQQFKGGELLFFIDIDLEIGPDFLNRARLNTIQGKQVYFPIFFKLYKLDFVHRFYKGNSSQLLSRHNGHWAHYSYGMVTIYASDYKKVGGFNTNMRGWGEEDVDFFNKVISNGLEVFRAPDPGLIHLWHPKVCNKETVVTPEAYFHCLQSKSENLADRVELAQYVFQNELKNGNTL